MYMLRHYKLQQSLESVANVIFHLQHRCTILTNQHPFVNSQFQPRTSRPSRSRSVPPAPSLHVKPLASNIGASSYLIGAINWWIGAINWWIGAKF